MNKNNRSSLPRELGPEDREIIQRIEFYINQDIPLAEKIRLARLIAVMDLEYDEVLANQGPLPAREVLRVSELYFTKSST